MGMVWTRRQSCCHTIPNSDTGYSKINKQGVEEANNYHTKNWYNDKREEMLTCQWQQKVKNGSIFHTFKQENQEIDKTYVFWKANHSNQNQ